MAIGTLTGLLFWVGAIVGESAVTESFVDVLQVRAVAVIDGLPVTIVEGLRA